MLLLVNKGDVLVNEQLMVTWETDNDYIPTTIEKKRAITWLFFMGIVMMLTRGLDLSVFERYYLSLSLSLRTIGLLLILVTLIIYFIATPLGYILVLVLLSWMGLWAFSVQQAWTWVYNHQFVPLKLLVWLGEWLLSLFSDEQTPPSDLENDTPPEQNPHDNE